ncbi:MAG TPA: UDP-N-acetylglucosamine diphosphorylase/glucosamine-1-phosphate N-acetyltransferase, partial [Cyanobacteria bacterium UBA8530]|nr:UDP-N-acetylglucosamine diphosphorylase/glucosamine-1-phosphate N-acetyltransferase [Cyanobacteria bacterium UBA8530]
MTAIAALILAAGKGTRMKSERPKVLHAIAGEPLLGHVLAALSGLKPERTVVVVGFGAKEVENYLKKLPLEVETVEQSEQKGTGHAVMMALPAFEGFEGDVLILSGDVPMISPATLEKMIETHRESRSSLTLLATRIEHPKGYGRIKREGDDFVGIVEERDASEEERKIKEINAGIYLARWTDLKSALDGLSNQNAQGEYYLTDVVKFAVADGLAVHAHRITDAVQVAGVNSPAQLAELERAYQRRRADELLVQGVRLADPARFDVRGELVCGQDVEIDVNCVFEGTVHLGDGVRIGANCVIANAVIGAGAVIHPFTHIEGEKAGVKVGAGALIGPFARLRPGADLGAEVHIGNFVEV